MVDEDRVGKSVGIIASKVAIDVTMTFEHGDDLQRVVTVSEEYDVVPVRHAAHVWPKLGASAPESSWERSEIFTSNDKLFDEAIRNPGATRRFLQVITDRREIIPRLVREA